MGISRKQWLDRHSRKLHKKKRVSRAYSYSCGHKDEPKQKSPYPDSDWMAKEYPVPENFSLTDNPDDTIQYFSTIIEGIKTKPFRFGFRINSAHVKNVTVDALIYLIAIMENMKRNKVQQFAFYGNLPDDKQARRVYNTCGFIDYVMAKDKSKVLYGVNAHIKSGTKNIPDIAKDVTDMVTEKLGIERKHLLFISKIIGELMSNVYHHAYPETMESEMNSRWYLYSECVGDSVKIIFADTGKGIPGTVRRRFSETLKQLLGRMGDEELLYGAFVPDTYARTETGQAFRGNGLPTMRTVVASSPIRDFWVFSGTGSIHMRGRQDGGTLSKHRLGHKIYGTIVAFEFKKGDVTYGEN